MKDDRTQNEIDGQRQVPDVDMKMNESITATIRRCHAQVSEAIHQAARASGRDPNLVRLVVVSKSQPLAVVRAAVETGISMLGENYAEEAVEKIHGLKNSEVEWHMIGHVQSRKAVLVAEHFTMLHSLDSLKLAEKLERSCRELGRRLPVLVEVNVSGEASKYGLAGWDENGWARLTEEIAPMLEYSHLDVRGLMTMPPYFDDPAQTRPYFRSLRKLQEYLSERLPAGNWTELSMGTSVDYTAAVEEGATYVRVGRAILGERGG